jgi:hypothetical protein
MTRREFFRLLAGTTAVLSLPSPLLWPEPAQAQNPPAGMPQPIGPPGGGPLGAGPAPGPGAGQANAVGQVGTLQGSATVTRGNTGAVPLKISDAIFKSDVLATGPNSALGITFDDETTFSLSANTRIVVNEFIYEEGGGANAATFNVAVGTAAFVASYVAKTGNMKISTPTATLGIRGTTGVVDVPAAGAPSGGEQRIKLYPDADGHVGRIEVFNPQGGRLGALTQGASAFSIQRGPGGGFRAVPFQIPPQEAARDRGVLQRLFTSHAVGRRMTGQRLRTRGFNRTRQNNMRPGRMQPSNRGFRPGGGPPHGGPRRGGGGGGGGRGRRR